MKTKILTCCNLNGIALSEANASLSLSTKHQYIQRLVISCWLKQISNKFLMPTHQQLPESKSDNIIFVEQF